jgi:Zn-finger protein
MMRKVSIILLSALVVTLFALPVLADGQATISGGKHDFTASVGTRTYTGLDGKVNAACSACHVPHNADTNTLIFTDSAGNYRDDTTTFNNTDGSFTTDTTRICMSCHDGSLATGIADSDMDAGDSYNLGQTLADDHPVDVPYNSNSTSGQTAGLESEGNLPAKTDITGTDDILSCGGCHDPHNNSSTNNPTRMFLIVDPGDTDICLVCHANK